MCNSKNLNFIYIFFIIIFFTKYDYNDLILHIIFIIKILQAIPNKFYIKKDLPTYQKLYSAMTNVFH